MKGVDDAVLTKKVEKKEMDSRQIWQPSQRNVRNIQFFLKFEILEAEASSLQLWSQLIAATYT